MMGVQCVVWYCSINAWDALHLTLGKILACLTCFIIPLYKKTVIGLVEDFESLQAKLPDKFMKLYANKIISIHVSCSDLIALIFTKILISYLFFVCSAYRKLVLSASPYIRRFIERNYRVQYYHRLIFLCWNKEPSYVFFCINLHSML